METNIYRCKICFKHFSTRKQLKFHSNIHNNPKKCELCNKIFPALSHLKRHSIAHEKNSPYECDICNKGFMCDSNLQRHKLCVHSNEPPQHACTMCDKRFRRLCQLKVHYRTHTGEKPYTCTVCNASFVQRAGLRNHYVIHAEESPHVLEELGINYTTFECDICFKICKWKSDLKKHKAIHSLEKPYKCGKCDACYSHPSRLQIHNKQRHSGGVIDKKQETCKVCKNSFHRSEELVGDSCSTCTNQGENEVGLISHRVRNYPTVSHYASRTVRNYPCPMYFAREDQRRNHYLSTCTKKGENEVGLISRTVRYYPTVSNYASGTVRNYPCPMCNMCFVQEDHLKNHYLIHMNPRSYIMHP